MVEWYDSITAIKASTLFISALIQHQAGNK
jgi:hypothetical protein